MNKNIRIFYAIILLVLVSVSQACTKDRSGDTPKSKASVAELMSALNIQHINPPVKAPDFELFSVTGEKVSLSQYRGKVVLPSFWATW